MKGKIDLQGAENSQGGNQSPDFILQLLAKNKISVQTMSWIEVIRRKHGFIHENEGTLPPGYKPK